MSESNVFKLLKLIKAEPAAIAKSVIRVAFTKTFEVGMQTIIQVEPNEWVTEQLLIAVTGLKPGNYRSGAKKLLASWTGI